MKINGTEYDAPVLNFKNMCELERQGLSISDISSRPLAFLAGFVGLAIGKDMEGGMEEIDAHFEGGGTLDELTDELNKAVDASGFFKGTAEEKAPA